MKLSIPEQHQKRIAIQTLKLHDEAVAVMGGMTKEEARSFLRRIGCARLAERIEREASSL